MKRVILAGILLCGVAHGSAATVVPGQSVALDAPCIGKVHVAVDPGLSSGASYDLTGAEAVVKQGGEETTVSVAACAPAAEMTVRLAKGTGLSIVRDTSTAYDATGDLPVLSATMAGGSFEIGTGHVMHLSLSGDARVHADTVDGVMEISAGGASVVRIDHAKLSAFSGQFIDRSQMMLMDGTADALNLVAAGQAMVTFDGTASVATVKAHGGSVVNVRAVTGPLVRSGDGSVRVSSYGGMLMNKGDAQGTAMPSMGGGMQ